MSLRLIRRCCFSCSLAYSGDWTLIYLGSYPLLQLPRRYNRDMRILAATLVFSAGSVLAGTLTGWISDASCGAANASAKAEARECAKNCLKNGVAPVFVSDKDGKVYKIAGTADAKAHLDYKVSVAGDVNGDTITIREIRKAD